MVVDNVDDVHRVFGGGDDGGDAGCCCDVGGDELGLHASGAEAGAEGVCGDCESASDLSTGSMAAHEVAGRIIA